MLRTRELILIFNTHYNEYTPIKISPRSKEIIELFMKGKTYKQIADQLKISVSGVRRHMEKIIIQNKCKSALEFISIYKPYYKNIKH